MHRAGQALAIGAALLASYLTWGIFDSGEGTPVLAVQFAAAAMAGLAVVLAHLRALLLVAAFVGFVIGAGWWIILNPWPAHLIGLSNVAYALAWFLLARSDRQVRKSPVSARLTSPQGTLALRAGQLVGLACSAAAIALGWSLVAHPLMAIELIAGLAGIIATLHRPSRDYLPVIGGLSFMGVGWFLTPWGFANLGFVLAWWLLNRADGAVKPRSIPSSRGAV